MKLNNLIKELYGSVDQMLSSADVKISRSYIYQLISGEKVNITVDTARELVKLLKLNSIEDLMELLYDSEEIQ